ncbi:MAG: 2-C-methyl-D-erythritol 2,4-cyclodiphosphate synthase [Clostridia bacterium]|nr:2-C-methyl-D-erythritol 2,4-cyclodiphosphate synthase [Clostridia bacterium]
MDKAYIAAVIAAAGGSTRMGRPKQLIPLCGVPALRRTLLRYDAAAVDEIIVVAPAPDIDAFLPLTTGLQTPCRIVPGGATRQQSVANGLLAVSPAATHIAIADGARPLITTEEIDRVIAVAKETGAAAAAVRCKDTIKEADAAGVVTATPDRTRLWQVQTPQVFSLPLYRRAMEAAALSGADFTDDCQLVEAIGAPVTLVETSYRNIKITTPEDVVIAEALLREGERPMRVGHGYDVHRLAPDRALILGGVTVPHETGLLGHSDADVLTHAIMDALLGSAGKGDIGGLFPDTDDAYKDADSIDLLRQVIALLATDGFAVENIDATVIAQRPKLKAYIPAMRETIAAACGIAVERVNIKATTEERLGFTGREEGVAAHAVCLLA